MSPTFLVIGGTGNTGQSVVKTLSNSLQSSENFAGYRILVTTRSSKSATAQQIEKLPSVEVVEKSWVEITPDWLREQQVERVFIAAYGGASQFAEESTFYVAALKGGVEYVVRISTIAASVRPDFPGYYPRTHWAIEQLLSAPEFAALKWSSLRAAGFTTGFIAPAVEFVQEFRKTGKQAAPLQLTAGEDGSSAVIHPDDVGVFAAKLLLEEDVSAHNKARYELSGPEDVTGRMIVDAVEKGIGEKVKDVRFKSLESMGPALEAIMPKAFIPGVLEGMSVNWDGRSAASGTSREVLGLHPPKITMKETLKAMLEA